MQNEKGRLRIHTSARPAEQEPVGKETAEEILEQRKERRDPLPEKKCRTVKKGIKRHERKKREMQEGMTVGEKLLRNTAVACALLLTVMSLKNVDQPWSRKMTEGVRQAMTMRIDWDETLGRLSFVRALVPETALVFLNLGANADLTAPVQAEISHEYTEQQPWLEYSCGAAQQVVSATDGIVTAVGQGVSGEWIVLIQGEEDIETVYGYLESTYVRLEQEIKAGQQIGTTADQTESRLYFEVREAGNAVDPTGRMK